MGHFKLSENKYIFSYGDDYFWNISFIFANLNKELIDWLNSNSEEKFIVQKDKCYVYKKNDGETTVISISIQGNYERNRV